MKISKTYQKITVWILKVLCSPISATLGVLCNTGGCTSTPTPLYGMPSADYTVSGKVQSFDSGEPIEGILVSIRDTSESSVIMDSIKTDSSGRYYLEFSNAPSDNIWYLRAKDIDSTENGLFLTKDTIVSVSESDLKEPGGSWYIGHAEINVDLKIERKK
jgi:putative lipoprotein (rSAM/lipoprotein system)